MKLRFQIGSNKPLGETESKDVLRRLLAEKVIDAEDLLFVEHLVQTGIQGHRTLQIEAKGLLHHYPGAIDQSGLAERADRRQRGYGWDAQVVQAPHLGAIKRRLGLPLPLP